MPYVVYQSEGRAHNLKLNDGSTQVGRGHAVDLRLRKDPKISSLHCTLECRADGSCHLGDENSKNGTYLNGKAVRGEKRLVKDGDVIRIGDTELIFRSKLGEGAAQPEDAPQVGPDEEEEGFGGRLLRKLRLKR